MAINHDTAKAKAALAPSRIQLPRPMLDFWNTPDKELVSLVKKMITLARQEAHEADGKGDSKRAGMLREALDFSSKKLNLITGGSVTGTDVGAELRQALNVLMNTIYLEDARPASAAP